MGFLDLFRREPCPPTPIEVKRILPLFCGRCGRPLVRESTPTGFDEQTGQRTFRNWLHRPRYKGNWHKDYGTPAAASAMAVNDTWTNWKYGWFGWTPGEVSYLTCKRAKKVAKVEVAA